jgi:hypothetical protein
MAKTMLGHFGSQQECGQRVVGKTMMWPPNYTASIENKAMGGKLDASSQATMACPGVPSFWKSMGRRCGP